jgi:rod shape-determining protein MreD
VTAAILHITVLGRLKIFNSRPDVVFSLIVFFALFANTRVAVESALVGGLVKDIFSSGRFGLNTLILTIAAFIISRISGHFYRESKFAQAVLTAASYMISAAACYLLTSIGNFGSTLGRDCLPSFSAFFISSAVPDGLYTSLVSMLIFPRLMEHFRISDRVVL